MTVRPLLLLQVFLPNSAVTCSISPLIQFMFLYRYRHYLVVLRLKKHYQKYY